MPITRTHCRWTSQCSRWSKLLLLRETKEEMSLRTCDCRQESPVGFVTDVKLEASCSNVQCHSSLITSSFLPLYRRTSLNSSSELELTSLNPHRPHPQSPQILAFFAPNFRFYFFHELLALLLLVPFIVYYLSIYEHLNCLDILAFLNNTAMSICVQIYFWELVSVIFGTHLDLECWIMWEFCF